MPHNILLTGASGYLGGSLLNSWQETNFPYRGNIYALVRNEAQGEKVTQYGAKRLSFSLEDDQAVIDAIVKHEISVVYFLVGAYYFQSQKSILKALETVHKATGKITHFLYTTGTKMFADVAGCPTDRPIYDTDPDLYDIQKRQESSNEELSTAVKTNCAVVDEGEKRGVRVYLFSPCVVYGKGTGFGNRISIQTVDIVMAFKACGYAYNVADDQAIWPVCHISDTVSLYSHILTKILNGEDPPHGKNGYYLASTGPVAWEKIYAAIASALFAKGVIADEKLRPIDQGAIDRIVTALGVDNKSSALSKISGNCTYTPRRGETTGWKPKFAPAHILESMDEEVEHILENLSDNVRGIR
ncbi:hypothetical protein CB0940_01250 [Cercospora beticola]|uniref:NmrA-like domain-containing protein n=1 Tax=Cercospora beticola TaxID=122368 RepID=A0A2G5IA76_CERBT|nr:hypothetical protein CB0940_01250 [Cercospora beticola]PIB01679.1 hypothetical protein CB0940_01250 [Cercospora beticola]WPA96681.1 hypothetical protein RHO25_001289 [Cercospora beticola]